MLVPLSVDVGRRQIEHDGLEGVDGHRRPRHSTDILMPSPSKDSLPAVSANITAWAMAWN